MVAPKDFNRPKHPEIDTKNLYVIKACQYSNFLSIFSQDGLSLTYS